MKLHYYLLISVACLSVVSVARAGTYEPSTDSSHFVQSVDWCQLAPVNCTATLPTPTAWVSTPSAQTGMGAQTGSAGMFYSGNDFTVTTDGFGMGLINTVPYTVGTTQYIDDVAATFDNLTDGAGAYIESSYTGNVFVTVWLFNDVYNTLTGWRWSVYSPGTAGTRLFVGATSSDLEVAGVIFDVSDTDGNTVPFSVGTLEFEQVPEPGSVALVAPLLLGLGVMLYKRASKS